MFDPKPFVGVYAEMVEHYQRLGKWHEARKYQDFLLAIAEHVSLPPIPDLVWTRGTGGWVEAKRGAWKQVVPRYPNGRP